MEGRFYLSSVGGIGDVGVTSRGELSEEVLGDSSGLTCGDSSITSSRELASLLRELLLLSFIGWFAIYP